MNSELHQSKPAIDSDKVEIGKIENGMMEQNAFDAQNSTDPNKVTIRSFAHFDGEKILRKMETCLLLMLTLLCLLFYLDRESIRRPTRLLTY